MLRAESVILTVVPAAEMQKTAACAVFLLPVTVELVRFTVTPAAVRLITPPFAFAAISE